MKQASEVAARRVATRSSIWTILLVAGLPLIAYTVQLFLFANHVNDDAYITFRYSAALADGLGPYWNPGEHVEGYTNFLWMLVLAPVAAVSESAVPAVARWVGALAAGAALVVGSAIALRATRGWTSPWRWATAAAGTGAVATFPGFALNATSGLETGLFALLVAGAVSLGRSRRGCSGAVWALAALTRAEVLAVFAVWWITRLVVAVRDHEGENGARIQFAGWVAALRRVGLDAVIVAAVLLGQLVFRWAAYDGEILPNTYWAKIGGYLGDTPLEYVRAGVAAVFLGPIGLAAGLGGAAWRPPGLRDPMLIEASCVGVVGAALPFFMGTDWMPGWRFSVPYLIPLSVGVATGWIALLRAATERTPRAARARLVAPLFVAAIVGASAASHRAERTELRELVETRAAAFETGHRSLARWITQGGVPAGGTIALMDIGLVGYTARDHRILDISGLTDRHIAKSPGVFLAKEYDPAYILDQEPDVIVIALTAAGDPSRPLRADQRLRAITRNEHRLATHEAFARHYRLDRDDQRPSDGAVSGGSWLEELADRLGATRVFEHRMPNRYYLLATYARTD